MLSVIRKGCIHWLIAIVKQRSLIQEYFFLKFGQKAEPEAEISLFKSKRIRVDRDFINRN